MLAIRLHEHVFYVVIYLGAIASSRVVTNGILLKAHPRRSNFGLLPVLQEYTSIFSRLHILWQYTLELPMAIRELLGVVASIL